MLITVSMHALIRWRERAAQYADAKVQDVAAAVQKAKVIGKDDFLPATIVRYPGHQYRMDESGEFVFVCHQYDVKAMTVVSVIPVPHRNDMIPHLGAIRRKKARARR